ncbi:pentatricopeptide repeat-containing protein [Sesbania bispinosa]|nr:pentatricopeptide repeat-containing protein [Sesbania bispinosa]
MARTRPSWLGELRPRKFDMGAWLSFCDSDMCGHSAMVRQLRDGARIRELQPFVPYLTLSLVVSILSWKSLHSNPSTTLHSFKWLQRYSPSSLSKTDPITGSLSNRPKSNKESLNSAPATNQRPGRPNRKKLRWMDDFIVG